MKSHQTPAKSAPKPATSASPAAGAGNAARLSSLEGRLGRAAAAANSALPGRERLEQSFGADLGDVRVAFGGDEVASLLAERGADAVAVGNSILFADANPSPELVAHEVTHVIQQRRGGGGGGETEAETGAQAVASGQAFDVQGGAEVGPQFAKSSGAKTTGSVTLSLSGAAVTPPAFPGGLSDVHDWLMDNQAALQSYSGKLTVRFSGTVQQDEQVIWAYYHPNQELVLEGKGKSTVTGFTESGGKQVATPGYFLCYRPIIPQAMSAENPAAANFDMHGLTVRGFVSGGVEISPRSGQMPSAETWGSGSYDEEQDHGAGGLSAFISGASIKDNTFDQMGTEYMKKGKERYAPNDPEGYKYAGYGGIVARGLNASTIAGNTFSNLENRDSDKTSESGGGDVNWLGLMHGVYLRDHSSKNSVRGNEFDTISGAPVKFTNASSYNKVRKNKAKNAGKDAFVLDHYSSKNPGGAPEADSLGYSNSGVQKADDGKEYLDNNSVGGAYEGYNKTRKMKEFRQKHVKA